MSGTADIAKTRIVIGQWRNTFVVAEDALQRPATHEVLRRVDRSVAEELPDSCAFRLGHWRALADEGMWLIRNLNLNFTLDLSKPGAGEVGAAWSDLLVARLAEIISGGADSDEGVLHFPSRAAYIAQFVLDLSGGRAWSKWYYEEFHSLAMLSTSRAIAEVFTCETREGARAIVQLAKTGRIDQLLPSLTEADARIICRRCFGGAQAGASRSPWVGRLLEVWREEPTHPARGTSSTFHHALRWLALVSLRFPALEMDSSACAAAEGLLEVRRVLEEMRSPTMADRLVRKLVEGTITIDEAIDFASQKGRSSCARALRFLMEAAQGDSDWAVQAAAVLLKEQIPPAAAILAGESMVSGFAGMFLLGPGLVRLNELLEAVLRQNENGQNEHANEVASFLRYLILVKCAGSARTLDASCDTALRLLSGCPRAQLREGLQGCPAFDLGHTYSLLLRDLPALTGCEARSLLAEAITMPGQGRELILLRDLARNEWLYAALLEPGTGSRESSLVTGLDLLRESVSNSAILLLHPSLAEMTESAALRGQVDHIVRIDNPINAEEVAAILSAGRSTPGSITPQSLRQMLGPSEHELSYFSLTNDWPDFDPMLDIFGTLLARAVMRQFARCLMGFQASSPEHLQRNFLEGAGTVRNLTERIEVELPRSPLSLVLQLSGMTRQSYAVPWLEGKEVCLLPPKE
jgi:hypothetical protein